jgi:hypothetical protein
LKQHKPRSSGLIILGEYRISDHQLDKVNVVW